MSKIFISTLSKKQKLIIIIKGTTGSSNTGKSTTYIMLYRMYKCAHWRTPQGSNQSPLFSLNNLLGEPLSQCLPDQITSQISFCKGSSDYVDPGNAVVAGWVKVRFCFYSHQMLSHLI